jgi:hypothetical protein
MLMFSSSFTKPNPPRMADAVVGVEHVATEQVVEVGEQNIASALSFRTK